MRPKVSIVIPSYNYGPFIAETLESVLKQTFQDYELIIVDDGSKDNSREIIEGYLPRFQGRLRLICQDNSGPSIARNTGIQNAKGEYIAFHDADDLWTETRLEKTVDYLDKNTSVGLVYANTEFFDSQTGLSLGLGHKQGGKKAYEGQCLELLFLNGNFITMMTTLVRRQVFEEVGIFDPHFKVGEDLDLWMRIAAKYPIGYINEVLCKVRRHGNNLSFNMREGAKTQVWGTCKILSLVPGLEEKIGKERINEKYYIGHLHLGMESILRGKRRVGRLWLKKALKFDNNVWRDKMWFYYSISFFPFVGLLNLIRQQLHVLRKSKSKG